MTDTMPKTGTMPKNNYLKQGLPERRYLPELHGLRGLALAGVVLFHIFGNGRVSGGIDIFLAISGFLFTGMLLREAAARDGRIDPLKYYGRLVRRILIPAAIVVVVTLVLALIRFPVTKHPQLWAEARASLLYFENLELINSQLTYGAAGPESSPFQHFWSLSVQGQFYVIWPAIAIIAVLSAKRLNKSASSVMAVLIGAVFLASFAYAIYVGYYNQDEAYLMTTTRAWQLAFGGLLALGAGTVKVSKPFRAPLGWLGLALIVSCGFLLDGAQLFPGPWALWPLTGLTLIMISAGPHGGENDPKGTATHFLSNKVFAWIGNHAYSLYLWHWPVMILYMSVRYGERLSIGEAFVILAITVVLAILTYRWIEIPLKVRQEQRDKTSARRASKITVSIAAGLLLLAGTGSTLIVNQFQYRAAGAAEERDAVTHPGALAKRSQHDVPLTLESMLPALHELPARPDYYLWGCRQPSSDHPDSSRITVCEDPEVPTDPRATVVLAGGSHAGQWHHAFRDLARENNWELQVVDRSACWFQDVAAPETDMCAAWQVNFMEWLDESDVDLVVTPGTRMSAEAEPEYIQSGAPDRWDEILATDTELLLIRGTMRHTENIADCLATNSNPTECGPDIRQIAEINPLEQKELAQGISTIDLTDYLCPANIEGEADTCSPIVGNVAVWRDNGHLSNLYVETMTPIIETELREAVTWLFED